MILTSNIGAELLKKGRVGFGSEAKADREAVLSEVSRYFRAEFMNRLDAILFFSPLSYESLVRIADNLLSELSERLLSVGISACFDASVASFLIDEKECARFGVRAIRRAMVERLENFFADALIKGALREGACVRVFCEDGAVKTETV